jgi:hypothetical protein
MKLFFDRVNHFCSVWLVTLTVIAMVRLQTMLGVTRPLVVRSLVAVVFNGLPLNMIRRPGNAWRNSASNTYREERDATVAS